MSGDQGDVSELITYLLPLLIKYKVHAYLCGHDHIGEHLQHANASATQFFIVGAGTMADTVSKTSAADMVWSGSGYASFANIAATSTTLQISYIDTSGRVRYQYQMVNTPTTAPTASPTASPTSDPSASPSAAPTAAGGGTGGGGGGASNGPVKDRSFWYALRHASRTSIALGASGVAALLLVIGLCAMKRKRVQIAQQRKRDRDAESGVLPATSNPMAVGTTRPAASYGLNHRSTAGAAAGTTTAAGLATGGGAAGVGGATTQDTSMYVELMELGEGGIGADGPSTGGSRNTAERGAAVSANVNERERERERERSASRAPRPVSSNLTVSGSPGSRRSIYQPQPLSRKNSEMSIGETSRSSRPASARHQYAAASDRESPRNSTAGRPLSYRSNASNSSPKQTGNHNSF
jgi:hypothetical protein